MTKQTNHKPGATTVASAIAPDAYTRITNRIGADLEQGVRPWCKPWGGDQLGARITRPRRVRQTLLWHKYAFLGGWAKRWTASARRIRLAKCCASA